MGKPRDIWERIDEKTDRRSPASCWPWKGSLSNNGRAVIHLHNRVTAQPVRRLLWVKLHGPIPEGRAVSDSCGTKDCVNPDHMKLILWGSTLADKFWRYVKRGDGCWEWQGHRDKKGYGRIQAGRELPMPAHRASYILNVGPIPDDGTEWCVCHRCDNPPCVRPDHLFLGTDKDNHDDMVRKGRHAHGPRLSAAVRAGHMRKKERRMSEVAEPVQSEGQNK
jgi:hypothetical protein